MRTAMILAAAVVLLTSAALAEPSGAGPLSDASFDDGTVTIGDQVFQVERTTEFFDENDAAISLLQLEYRLGEYVLYTGRAARPLPVLVALQIEPEDAPGEE